MIVDTATLAKALGCTPRHITRLAAKGVLHEIAHPRPGRRQGRPSKWFDLDTSMRLLDKDPPRTETTQ